CQPLPAFWLSERANLAASGTYSAVARLLGEVGPSSRSAVARNSSFRLAATLKVLAPLRGRERMRAVGGLKPPRRGTPMGKNHVYVLGLNAYDHDVSACLLRDGEIAFAINKERITREKHDTGFYQEVVDYCLSAENISLDDVDLVVRNCYV